MDSNSHKDYQDVEGSLSIKDKDIMDNIHKGTLMGTARSIIIDYIDSFNLFNIRNDFELKLGKPNIRYYKAENIYCPDDIRYVSTLAKDSKSIQFIQIFFPINTLYIVLDHILGGKGNGEYGKEMSEIDKSILDWYFNFYTYYSDSSKHDFYHKSDVDILGTSSINPLFSGLNIILAYIPILINDKPFGEIIIRINSDKLDEINRPDTRDVGLDSESDKKLDLFTVNKMSTDTKLEDILSGIV